MSKTVQPTTIRAIRISELGTDYTVQRPVNQHRVERIAENFNPAAVRTLAVSKRDDRYVVLDGNHRLHAMRELGFSNGHLVQCEVYTGLSIEEEASLFLEMNDGKKPTYRESFPIRVTQRDPDALAVKEIIESAGFTVAKDGRAAEGSIRAVDSVERVYKAFAHKGDRRFYNEAKQALLIIKAAWGIHPEALQMQIIRGAGIFVLTYGVDGFDFDRLVAKLSKSSPNSIIVWARNNAAVVGGSVPRSVGEAFQQRYNAGLRAASKRLPHWRSERA